MCPSIPGNATAQEELGDAISTVETIVTQHERRVTDAIARGKLPPSADEYTDSIYRSLVKLLERLGRR